MLSPQSNVAAFSKQHQKKFMGKAPCYTQAAHTEPPVCHPVRPNRQVSGQVLSLPGTGWGGGGEPTLNLP